MRYLDQLDGALRDCGFAARRRRRIVAEFADHLQENPSADIGDPAQIARRFADELGTHRARTAAVAAFAALTIAGIMVLIRGAVMLPLTFDGSGFDAAALLVAFLAGQLAFAAGGLALLRALRSWPEPTIPRREAVVLALAAAAPAVIRAARVRPLTAGPAGDLLADLGRIVTPIRTPTGFALIFAGALAVVVTMAGIAANDPYDGAIRGVLEGAACLAGYGLLGGYLGLRSGGLGVQPDVGC